MNIINLLFNKTKIKMEKHQLLLAYTAAYAFYDSFEASSLSKEDTERKEKLIIAIDKLTDELVKDTKLPVKKEVETTKPGQTEKKDLVDKNSPRPGAKNTNKEEKEKEEKPKEEINEALVEVFPFHPCKVTKKGAKFSKEVRAEAPKAFKAWKDLEAAKQAKGDDKYPDIDTLDLVFDEAWDMACKGDSNRAILDMFKKELKGFYPELKSDSDWYAKVVNPIAHMVLFIRNAFAFPKEDGYLITRPDEANMSLEYESDCTPILKKEEKEKPEIKKPEEKKDLKTVQAGKGKPPETKKPVDEEVQDKGKGEAEEEDENLEIPEENEERNTEEPPEVHAYDDFDDIETLIFDKIIAGAKIAGKMKDEASKKAAQAENREEVRNLIAANFEGEPWTIKTTDGKWNPKLIDYHNAIIREIKDNSAKWSKKE